MKKVYIASCPQSRKGVEDNLRYFYGCSDLKHVLVDSRESADIILIAPHPGDNQDPVSYYKNLAKCQIISKYPNKTFTITTKDTPTVLNRGVYASAVKSLFNLGRFRTGGYIGNTRVSPWISSYQLSDEDFHIKNYLFSFIGRKSHPVRTSILKINFERKDTYVEDSTKFSVWHCDDENEKNKRQLFFRDKLLRSKFSLCPRGTGTSTFRIYVFRGCPSHYFGRMGTRPWY